MTAGAAAASLHDLNQESFMKIAVKNLSGLAALLLFAAATLATAYAHDRKTIDVGTITITTVDPIVMRHKRRLHSTLHG
jgi:hypothetical protein